MRPCRSRALYRSYRGGDRPAKSGALTRPAPGSQHPGQRSRPPPPLQPHLPPLPKLLLHQGADTELLVHLLQQFGLWDEKGVTYDLMPFSITGRHVGLYQVGAQKGKEGPMGQLLRIQSRSQRPQTSDLSGPGPLPRTGLRPHQPARLQSTKRPPRAAQALTLFSAKSFSFCSCRLRSIQAAVSSSQGSSSPSVFIFLKRGESGLLGAPLLFPAPDSRAPGWPPQHLPFARPADPPHPSFWFRRRFSLAAASFSRSSSRCLKAMGLMTSAATGSSLVPASGRGAQT